MKNNPQLQEFSINIPAPTRHAIFVILASLLSVAGCDIQEHGELSFDGKEIPLCHEMEGYRSPKYAPPLSNKLSYAAKVHCVIDGDTYVVRLINGDRLMMARIWGADCPESTKNKKCMDNGKKKCEEEVVDGTEVKKKAQRMFGDGDIILRPPFQQNGKRKLTYIDVKGIDIGRGLISSCLCSAPKRYDHIRKQDYRRAAERCNK